MKDTQIEPTSKSELARSYKVSTDTFIRWLQPFEKELIKLGYKREQQIFTIAQVILIHDKLGRP